MKPVNSPAFFMLWYQPFLERTTIFTPVLAQIIVIDTYANQKLQNIPVQKTLKSN